MIDLDEDRFEKIMSVNILQQGFEQTMINIIFPFLSKIGMLWQTGAIGPAQEHFITYLIRQKLMVAIDGQIPSKKTHPKKYMLFLPDGELHEISLLFANFLLRSRQNKVVYLGQSLPFQDLCAAYDIHKPHYLFSIITSTPSHHEVQPYVDRLAARFPQAHILLTGYQVVAQDINTPGNVTILKSICEMISFIEVHE
jgi:MerR family transcriptional regulator, light-induced transcriptional regulator